MNTLKSLLIIIFILFASEAFAGYDKLDRKNYEESKNEKGVILYGVNWGRQWGCAGLDNAQLQNLTFSRIDSASGDLGGGRYSTKYPSKIIRKKRV